MSKTNQLKSSDAKWEALFANPKSSTLLKKLTGEAKSQIAKCDFPKPPVQ